MKKSFLNYLHFCVDYKFIEKQRVGSNMIYSITDKGRTMLDLFTIQQSHGTLEGLTVILAGDLRYGRTDHSLSHALVRFGCRLIFASPELLRMPAEIVEDLREHGADVTETDDLLGNINQADVVYMTRIQKERFAVEDEYAKVAGAYKLHAGDLGNVKSEMIIMHPLPRVDEIHPSEFHLYKDVSKTLFNAA